ncbi:MAG: archease [Candidatus Hodarchaeota archaeon]
MRKVGFKFLDHTADVSVESWGSNLEEAFSQTALSLITTITPDLNQISLKLEKKVEIEAEDKEALLFDFLSEFLYLFDVYELVFGDIIVQSIKKSQNRYKLQALLKGEKFDKKKHKIGTEVKAITYSFMSIKENKNKVTINTVFDI